MYVVVVRAASSTVWDESFEGKEEPDFPVLRMNFVAIRL